MLSMKKVLSVITILLILSTFSPLFTNGVYAEESTIDQQNTDVSGGAYKIYGRNTGELFVPTVNRITRADVFIRYPVTGSWLEARLVKGSNGLTIATSGTRMSAGDDEYNVLETIGFGEVEVEPGEEYFLYLDIDNPTYQTMWRRSNSNTYDIGVLTIDGDLYGDRDFGFKIWGYTYSEDPPTPPEEDGEGDEDGEEDSEEENDENEEETTEDNDTENNGVQDADDITTEESDDVESPTLEYLKKNEEPVEDIDIVEAEDIDTVTVGGSSFAGAKVILIIGDKAYETTADEEGKWEVIIDMQDIKEGEYTVQAQAINEDEVGSKKADLFILKSISNVQPINWAEPQTVEPTLWEKLTVGSMRTISIAVLSFLLIILIAILIIVVSKNQKKDKKSKEQKIKPEKDKSFKKKLMEEAKNKVQEED